MSLLTRLLPALATARGLRDILPRGMTLNKMAGRKQTLSKVLKGFVVLSRQALFFSVIFATLLMGGDSKNGSGHLFVAVGIIFPDMDIGRMVGSEA